MSVPFASSLLVLLLALAACVVAFPEQRARPIRCRRLAVVPLLVAAATLIVLCLPPSNDLWDPQVWVMGVVAAVLGLARGAMLGLRVDQGYGELLLRRAPEGFWITVVSALLILADIVAEPFGRLDSSFVKTVELALVILSSFLVGRNAILAVRSRDAPHHDL
jgi:hypothetical protein